MLSKQIWVRLILVVALGTGLGGVSASVVAADTPLPRPYVIVLPVNVNSATGQMLERSMIGVGPKKAAAIIDYRKRMGLFEDLDAVLNVPGIGPGTLRKNLGRITVESE